MAPDLYDVVVVGCGPVGMLTAIQLGLKGRQVLIAERWSSPYPLPRAVTFDHEIARILAAVGLGEQLSRVSEPAREYEWQNAAGQRLLRFTWDQPGTSGWPRSSMFAQPGLEGLLVRRLAELPTVTLRRGWEFTGVEQDAAAAHATLSSLDGAREVVHASYVVGCDGANSAVREHLRTSVTDLGFAFDWLIVDVVPDVARPWIPENLQICDPARPTTVVSGGPGRRRFEFMRLPHESREQLNQAETAWELVRPFGLAPDNAELERHAVYTFQARWADNWRDGRLLLAGDAAHLMPPFAGQGMCSGLRDAANLAWKLDLVLGGRAPDRLLDSYGAERAEQVRSAIDMSMELGKVICVLDPGDAAERDRAMGADSGGTVLDNAPGSALVAGLLARTAEGTAAPLAGLFCPQGRVRWKGRTGLFDQAVGTGFVVAARFDPATELDAEGRAFCQEVGAHLVHLGERDQPPGTVADLDGTYRALLDSADCDVLIVRPDFYVFGAAPRAGLGELLAGLRNQLGVRLRPTPTTTGTGR
ncbi:bifunctional 3-(3-hydroxy-phenyl)propionate/3-hydroxycinnamic acid hydroxylase [Streptomyces sp. NPDC006285]|uniref:bifunctional 3-(3-hydroxy-phenyl)propionate/3-hydroxycinnamic acid hydroxylase MhpA n=1 Tax=Streptomyces sp. NPDC006285 TaxID=3364742 RepID=UPI0036C2E61E